MEFTFQFINYFYYALDLVWSEDDTAAWLMYGQPF